jgi:hypothetical protein
MVKKMLVEVAGQETEFERLRREEHKLRARLLARGVRFKASGRLSRTKLYERHALR